MIDPLDVLCAQLTRDLFAIAKFLFLTDATKFGKNVVRLCNRNFVSDLLAFWNASKLCLKIWPILSLPMKFIRKQKLVRKINLQANHGKKLSRTPVNMRMSWYRPNGMYASWVNKDQNRELKTVI